MVLDLRSGINVLFPSVRAGRTWGFSISSKVTRDDIMGSTVGEQQERGMSISGQTVPSAQLCLRARDVIQLGHSRVYAETIDELKECFGSGVRGCFRFEDVLQSQRLATFEYGFGIEIRVLRWGLRKCRCDYRSVSYCVNASPRAMVFAEVISAISIRCCEVFYHAARSAHDIHGVGRHVAQSTRDIHGVRVTLLDILGMVTLRLSVRTVVALICADTCLAAPRSTLAALSHSPPRDVSRRDVLGDDRVNICFIWTEFHSTQE
ncbi:hypothetical protein EDB83DRAFT_2317154 [Lactarius deliciosus]|nr:hypothetical protein EDB83DRAFT_2317154 [Lactarius deliciosus]